MMEAPWRTRRQASCSHYYHYESLTVALLIITISSIRSGIRIITIIISLISTYYYQ